MGLNQLLTQLEGPRGHEVKKRKATRAKQGERKLKKRGPGLLIQRKEIIDRELIHVEEIHGLEVQMNIC